MKTSQSFPFYPSDFLMGTALLTAEEVGAFMRLLCYQWQEGSIPKDENLCARLAQTNVETISAIIGKFRLGADGKLRNRKMEEVRKSLNIYKKSRSENGKKGGRPKKHMVSVCLPHGKHSESLPSPSPLPSPLPLPLPNTPLPPEGEDRVVQPKLSPKRQGIESDIREADETSIPEDLNTQAFRDSWEDWCLHRAELYRRNPAKRWSGQAARNTLAECSRNGPEASVKAITSAIANGWQGLVWKAGTSASQTLIPFAQQDLAARRA